MFDIEEHIKVLRSNIDINIGQYSIIYSTDIISDYKITYNELMNIINNKVNTKYVKRTVYISIEMVQNVIKHGDFDCDSTNSVFFVINNKNNIFLISGNKVNDKSLGIYLDKISYINSLNEDDLNNYYFYNLNNKGFTEKGGASLGLIEMARKSKNKIKHTHLLINGSINYIYTIINFNIE